MSDYISEVFGDGGLFASRFPGYEMREGQVALARMVDEAMSGGRHALGEGPCGTGKSVAYAVPAVYRAHHDKKRVVIATANIALQEQLVRGRHVLARLVARAAAGHASTSEHRRSRAP